MDIDEILIYLDKVLIWLLPLDKVKILNVALLA